MEMRIHWLLLGEARSIRRAKVRGKITIISAESVPEGMDLDSGSRSVVYLSHGAEVVKVEVIRGD